MRERMDDSRAPVWTDDEDLLSIPAAQRGLGIEDTARVELRHAQPLHPLDHPVRPVQLVRARGVRDAHRHQPRATGRLDPRGRVLERLGRQRSGRLLKSHGKSQRSRAA